MDGKRLVRIELVSNEGHQLGQYIYEFDELADALAAFGTACRHLSQAEEAADDTDS